MEGVCKEIAFGFALLNEACCELADLGDNDLRDHSSDVFLRVLSGFSLELLNFNFDDIQSLL